MTVNLNKRNLSLLWSAQIISAAGDAVYQLALLWLVLDMTNSSTMTGLVAMSAYLPALIFGLYAGVMADKLNRLWLMMIASAGQALTVLLIPFSLWFGYKNILLVGGLAFLRSCFNTLFQPAFNSFIPMLFPKKRLVRVNALLATSGQLAWMLGPFFAGVLLSISSLPNLFIVDSTSFIAAIFLLFFLRRPARLTQLEEHNHWQELKDGLSYLAEQKPLFWMIIITFINNLFIMGPAIVGLPVLIKHIFHGSASDFAFAEGCMASGALLGSFIVSKFSKKFTKGAIWGIGLCLDGITYSFFYWAPSVEIVMVMLFLHGIGIPLIMVSRTSIIQAHTPNKYHGRLFAVVHLGVVGTTAISSALVGIISAIISVKLLFFAIGVGAALCGLLALVVAPIRQLN